MQVSTNPVWNFLDDLNKKKDISEVMINAHNLVFVERENQITQLDVEFERVDLYDFLKDVAKLNNRKITMDDPILDGILPDGSRLNAIIEPYSALGPSITIRKYIKKKVQLGQDLLFGIDPFWTTFLKSIVHSRQNILVSGATGSGKTTLLNMLLGEIDLQDRVIAIEDTKELDIANKNTVRLEVIKGGSLSNKTVGMREMVKNTLRMRPDRIIIGEIRGEEVFDLLMCMNVGHDGSMSSIHANSSVECLKRLESLFLLSGYDVPYKVVRRQIAYAVNYIIQLEKNRDGHRMISDITEVTGMEGDMIQINQLAYLNENILTKTGRAPKNIKQLHRRSGLPLEYFSG